VVKGKPQIQRKLKTKGLREKQGEGVGSKRARPEKEKGPDAPIGQHNCRASKWEKRRERKLTKVAF